MYFKPRIFISSTMGDKLQLRKSLKENFEKLGAEVALYEKDLTPSVDNNTYREDILQTDFAIFIIDERYGAKTNFGISGTEEEFDIVSFHKKPCHVYLKKIVKTEDAQKFEDKIKSKGISFFYYENEKELLQRIKSTTFTVAKDILISNLNSQRIEQGLVKELAVSADYKWCIFYCKRFERIFELFTMSNEALINSNLLIASMESCTEYYLKNNNIFIDKKLYELFKPVFIIVSYICSKIATNSTPGVKSIKVSFPGVDDLEVTMNSQYDSNFISELYVKINELRETYDLFKSYVASMKLQSDLNGPFC